MKEILENQYKNIFLWSPFVMAFGMALYFSLDKEPNFNFPYIIALLLCGVIYKFRNIFIRAFAIFWFGFFYAMSFTLFTATPQINNSFGAVNISGTIKDIDYRNDATRIFLDIPISQINQKDETNKHANIRISLKDIDTPISIGDTISGNAIIFRPTSKFAPDSFNFARWAYFTKISGTGFFNNYEINPSNNNHNNYRTYIHNKSKSVLTDALVLGYKNAISKDESNIWKSIGMGHIWSISGFHMTLVGGWLFFLFYLIFRSISPITKRIPAKYPAMICAWIGLLFYLCISGISVATVRAFLMTTLIFSALIFGRAALNLRNAVLVFTLILLLNPFYVMHPGFQLSFAAIFGLIWYFQDKTYQKRTTINRILHSIYATAITAFIATIFTLPFIIAHFGFIPTYSLIGNIIILPVFSVVIMPMVMIGTIFALFGNLYILNTADSIYQFAFDLGKHITNLPNANLYMGHISNTVLIMCIIGILSLILIINTDNKNFIFKKLNYLIGGAFILSAVIIYTSTPKPLFYASTDHELVGFIENNKIKFNKSRSSKHYFAFDTWRQFNHEKPNDKNERYKCKKGLCIYKTPNWNLVYMQKFTTLMDNLETVCNNKKIDYIVSPLTIDAPNCHAKILQKGIMIYPSGKIIEIINQRPWDKLPE